MHHDMHLQVMNSMRQPANTVSGVITEVQEHPDLCDNEKSFLIYAFALAGRASVIKMSEMEPAIQDKLIQYLKETIRLKELGE